MTKKEEIKRIVAILDDVRKEAWHAGYEFARLMENDNATDGGGSGATLNTDSGSIPQDYNPPQKDFSAGLPPSPPPIPPKTGEKACPELKVPRVDLKPRNRNPINPEYTPTSLPKARRREQ